MSEDVFEHLLIHTDSRSQNAAAAVRDTQSLKKSLYFSVFAVWPVKYGKGEVYDVFQFFCVQVRGVGLPDPFFYEIYAAAESLPLSSSIDSYVYRYKFI